MIGENKIEREIRRWSERTRSEDGRRKLLDFNLLWGQRQI
jgi:hypothetical protein